MHVTPVLSHVAPYTSDPELSKGGQTLTAAEGRDVSSVAKTDSCAVAQKRVMITPESAFGWKYVDFGGMRSPACTTA